MRFKSETFLQSFSLMDAHIPNRNKHVYSQWTKGTLPQDVRANMAPSVSSHQ